jgi:uncharacterized protein
MDSNTTGPKPVAAAVKVTVTTDSLQAHLYIEPPKYDGPPSTPDMLDKALTIAKVAYGIDMQLLERLKKEPQYSREFLIASGVAPVKGTDGAIKYCFQSKTEVHPKLREDGTVDFFDLGLVINVKKGQTLAEITLATPGAEGTAVTGKKLQPTSGKAVPSPMGRNTELNPEGTRLLATVDGHVSLNGARVNVVETFVVSGDVDVSTGNIKSVCNVSVVGTVQEGFSIEADGNVDIGGSLTGGSIKAGGNVTIHGGVVGMGRSRIECKGNLTSSFFENCAASAGGEVKTESVMNSNINCTGKLEVAGHRAKLMGGRFVVGGDVIAYEIGSFSNIATEIVLGADPALMTRYSALAAEKKELAVQIEKLRQIVDLLGKYQQAGQLPPSKLQMLENSHVSLDASVARLTACEQEYEKIGEQIENSGKGKVICRGTVYRGVKMSIGFASMAITNDISASSFSFVDGKIAITPISSV